MKKRDDLQCLRALAIIAVVAFHLEPKKVPFGYLGVDVFFVISGFLMTVIVSKKNSILQFYSSRIKRIVPVYLFVILISCGFGYYFLLTGDYKFLKQEVICSMLFINNLCPIFHRKQYFELVTEYKFLLHTWSLGVEVQFYLIAPFLLKFLLSRKHSLLWTFVLSLASFIFSITVPSKNISFGFLFSRIWQFLIGTIVFITTQKKEEQEKVLEDPINQQSLRLLDDMAGEVTPVCNAEINQKKHPYKLSFVTFVALAFISFFPLSFENINGFSTMLRFCSTIFAGSFIAFDACDFMFYPLNHVLVYIGDISYAIYLVHWPIIIIFKYFSISYGIILITIVITIGTLSVNKLVEIRLQKESLKLNVFWILTNYIFIIVLCCINSKKTRLLSQAIAANEAEAESCNKLYYQCNDFETVNKYFGVRANKIFGEEYCSYKINSNSTKTVMMTGNSFVYFQNRGIVDAVKQSKQNFSEAILLTYPVCSILAGNFNKNISFCKEYPESFAPYYAFMNATRPDVIIHSARMNPFIYYNSIVAKENFTDDDVFYNIFKSSILNISNYTRRLIIIEPNPHFLDLNFPNPLKIAQTLFVNGSTSAYNITLQDFHERHNPTWNRIKEAVKHCTNCVIVPTQQLFCDAHVCPMVDPKTQISKYCDYHHMTPTYSTLLTPLIVRAIDEENPVF